MTLLPFLVLLSTWQVWPTYGVELRLPFRVFRTSPQWVMRLDLGGPTGSGIIVGHDVDKIHEFTHRCHVVRLVQFVGMWRQGYGQQQPRPSWLLLFCVERRPKSLKSKTVKLFLSARMKKRNLTPLSGWLINDSGRTVGSTTNVPAVAGRSFPCLRVASLRGRRGIPSRHPNLESHTVGGT